MHELIADAAPLDISLTAFLPNDWKLTAAEVRQWEKYEWHKKFNIPLRSCINNSKLIARIPTLLYARVGFTIQITWS